MSSAARKLKSAVAQPPAVQPKLRITQAPSDEAPGSAASWPDAGPISGDTTAAAGDTRSLICDALGADATQASEAESGAAGGRAEPMLTLRRATPMDFEPLCFFFDTALRRDYFLRRGQLREMLDSPHHGVFVAEVDAVLVGVAITTRRCRLVNALIHPNVRGLGIGRALVDYCGATEVRAKLDMSSGDPRPFYRSLGFESVARIGAKRNIELMRIGGATMLGTVSSGARPRRRVRAAAHRAARGRRL